MPTNMSMSDIVNPALEAGSQGTAIGNSIGKNVTDMANTMQNLQLKQQQQQMMQQKLDDMKVDSFQKRANLVLSAPDGAVKNGLIKQNQKWMQQNGMDPLIMEGLKDSDFAGQYQDAIAAEQKAVQEAQSNGMAGRTQLMNQLKQNGMINTPQGTQQLALYDQQTAQNVSAAKMPSAQKLKLLAGWEQFQPSIAHVSDRFQQQNTAEALKGMQFATQQSIANQKNATTERGQDIGYDKTKLMADAIASRQAQQVDRIHNQNVAEISKDPGIQKQQIQLNNLNNALSNISAGQAPTPESFAELQQSVRSNLGIKGTSGVNERGSTFLKGIGMSPAEWEQFISMKPQDITKYGGTEFLDHIKALATNEMNNVRTQAQQKVNTLVQAHQDFYKRHPDLKKDYDNFTYHMGSDVLGTNPAQGAPTAPGGAPTPKAPQAPAAGPDLSKLTPAQQKTFADTKAQFKGKFTDQQILDSILKHGGQ
jgi:hypothetical protein